MGPIWWIVLAKSIWIVYNTDHLIDTYQLKGILSDERRLFYSKNFNVLILLSGILLTTTITLSILYLSVKIIAFGLVLGFLTATYLLLVFLYGRKKKLWLQKEILVSIIYTSGIWGSIILVSNKILDNSTLITLSSFFLLVLADILIIAFIESDKDYKNQFSSLPQMVNKRAFSSLTYTILATSTVLAIMLILNSQTIFNKVGILLLIMGILLAGLQHFNKALLKNHAYRLISEAIFFIPAIMAFI